MWQSSRSLMCQCVSADWYRRSRYQCPACKRFEVEFRRTQNLQSWREYFRRYKNYVSRRRFR